MTRTFLLFTLPVFVLSILLFAPRVTRAVGNPPEAPGLTDLRRSVQNGAGDVLRGVFVSDVLALPVTQQPEDQPYYVSDRDGEATQFALASRYGTIGLLAHNTRAGAAFSDLSPGQDVSLVYGDGRVEHFVVTGILRFQATSPESVSSSFRDLDRNETLSSAEVFRQVYGGERRLIFQTCLEGEGNPSWGRLFVIAIPKG